MGIMTFEEITAEASMNIGGKRPSPQRLLTWVNFAVQTLASEVDFPELKTTSAIATVANDDTITAPTDLLGVDAVKLTDDTSGTDVTKKLLKMEEAYNAVDADAAQIPTHWMRRGTEILLWPEPDAIYAGVIEYVKTPAKVTDLTGVSAFPSIWDQALVLLTTHHGFASLSKMEESILWLNAFSRYKSKRMTNLDVEKGTPRAAGLDVAWERSDLQDDPSDV